MPVSLRIAVLAVASVLLAPGAARAREESPHPPGPLATYVAHDGDAVVVVDAADRKVVMYRVLGDRIELAEVRDLAADLLSGERREEKAGTAPVPGGDAVGEDPPGFVRPPETVRMSSLFSTERGPAEYWSAGYLVRGSVESVWEASRTLYPGWSVVDASVDPRTDTPRAMLTIEKGGDRLAMNLARDPSEPDGWVRLRVELWRKAPVAAAQP